MKTSWGIFTAALIGLTALVLSPLTRNVPEIAQLQRARARDAREGHPKWQALAEKLATCVARSDSKKIGAREEAAWRFGAE